MPSPALLATENGWALPGSICGLSLTFCFWGPEPCTFVTSLKAEHHAHVCMCLHAHRLHHTSKKWATELCGWELCSLCARAAIVWNPAYGDDMMCSVSIIDHLVLEPEYPRNRCNTVATVHLNCISLQLLLKSPHPIKEYILRIEIYECLRSHYIRNPNGYHAAYTRTMWGKSCNNSNKAHCVVWMRLYIHMYHILINGGARP